MGDPDDILFDYGTFVQDIGHIVAGGSDQFYSLGKGCVIGLCTGEGW
jgi:hypothetical protein